MAALGHKRQNNIVFVIILPIEKTQLDLKVSHYRHWSILTRLAWFWLLDESAFFDQRAGLASDFNFSGEAVASSITPIKSSLARSSRISGLIVDGLSRVLW